MVHINVGDHESSHSTLKIYKIPDVVQKNNVPKVNVWCALSCQEIGLYQRIVARFSFKQKLFL